MSVCDSYRRSNRRLRQWEKTPPPKGKAKSSSSIAKKPAASDKKGKAAPEKGNKAVVEVSGSDITLVIWFSCRARNPARNLTRSATKTAS